MATKTKIKISDDTELRGVLDDEYAKTSQIKLCKYALLLSTHILTVIGFEDIDNPIIREGYAVNESWQRGDASMHDVRQVALQIHRLAKISKDIVTQTALRTVGQAVATGHMPEHAMVASDYAVKVINILFPNDVSAVRKERLWQIKNLRDVKDFEIL